MSVAESETGPLTRAKLLLLEGYKGLRRRPWLFPFLVAVVLLVVGYLLDPARPFVDHGVFAGMFLIWSATAAVIGVLVYVTIRGLVLWSRYKEETY